MPIKIHWTVCICRQKYTTNKRIEWKLKNSDHSSRNFIRLYFFQAEANISSVTGSKENADNRATPFYFIFFFVCSTFDSISVIRQNCKTCELAAQCNALVSAVVVEVDRMGWIFNWKYTMNCSAMGQKMNAERIAIDWSWSWVQYKNGRISNKNHEWMMCLCIWRIPIGKN